MSQLEPKVYKWENDWIPVFDRVSSDASTNQITISDGRVHATTPVECSQTCRGPQKRVTIYDLSECKISWLSQQRIKARKVIAKFRPTAAPLRFDLGGEFLSAFALAPSHAISRLVVDDRSHILDTHRRSRQRSRSFHGFDGGGIYGGR